MIVPGITPPLPAFRGRPDLDTAADLNAAPDGWSIVGSSASNKPAGGSVLGFLWQTSKSYDADNGYRYQEFHDAAGYFAWRWYYRLLGVGTWSDWQGASDTPWTAATIGTDWTDVTTYGGTRYRRVGGVVQLVVEATSAGGAPKIFTLPSGYRPSQDLRAAAFAMRTSTAGAALIITSGGYVQISSPTGGSTYQGFAQFPLKVT